MEALLDSEEVKKAKSARATAKGQLTRISNTLKKDLVIESGSKYDFKKLDKFSIKADAEKLENRLLNLQQKNEEYSAAGISCLQKAKANDEVIGQFEDDVDIYWTDARKEASVVLNLYKFEYSTELDRYLKNIDEECKPPVKLENISSTEVTKAKRKAETEDQQVECYENKMELFITTS